MKIYVHFLAEQKGGPIRTSRREVFQEDKTAVICAGGEYIVACDPKRRHLALLTPSRKKVIDFFLATGDPVAVSCPKCLATSAYLRVATPPESKPEEA